MAVLKEWTCKNCNGYQFEGISDECPLCGESSARAFRTPPGYITKGLVKRFESVLGQELADRGLSDLPKPKDVSDYEPRAPEYQGQFDKCSGRDQAAISPSWGRGKMPASHSPAYSGGESFPVVDTNMPKNFLKEHTQVIARIDKNGNRIG